MRVSHIVRTYRDAMADGETDGTYRLVRYRRPNLRQMQLYTLDDQLRLFKTARPGVRRSEQEDVSASIAADPTRLQIPRGAVFGPETVRQVWLWLVYFWT